MEHTTKKGELKRDVAVAQKSRPAPLVYCFVVSKPFKSVTVYLGAPNWQPGLAI